MVTVFASIVIYRVCQSWLDQYKDYEIDICCFTTKHTALRGQRRVGFLIRIMCPSGGICLPVDCCLGMLAL
jgi:hypothetical protein